MFCIPNTFESFLYHVIPQYIVFIIFALCRSSSSPSHPHFRHSEYDEVNAQFMVSTKILSTMNE